MWSIGSSLSDEVSSAEFSCINNDRYRNFVTGLHLQSLTQRHHFHQQKSSAHRVHPKTQQQQNNLRNNISNQQHDARPLHQTQGYHIYHATQEEHQKLLLEQQNQPALGQDIFGVNAILSNTDKYFSHNIECRNDGGDTYKHQLFNTRQQAEQHLNISRQHPHATRSDISSDEVSNHIYIQHNGHEIDVKYTPPHKTIYNFETQNLNKPDVNHRNKRSADISFSNTHKTVNSKEEGSGIVDCDREDIKRKRKKCHMSSMDYDDVEIKAEADSESELRNIDIPLRNKSY
ncbi:uncharacterized protein LOC119607559 isoform X2 [Lucilia sericata]|nr:uncharacterized protein LOC119607559 isoform X2 [Lucilia sericata]